MARVFSPRVLILVVLLASASTNGSEKTLDSKVRQILSNRYPGEEVTASCRAAFLGKPRDTVAALSNSTKRNFRVVWVRGDGEVRELQSLAAFGRPSDLELKCLDAKQAQRLKHGLEHSEAIHDFLRLSPGKGLLCYFVEQTQSKCWSVNTRGELIDVGGWQT